MFPATPIGSNSRDPQLPDHKDFVTKRPGGLENLLLATEQFPKLRLNNGQNASIGAAFRNAKWARLAWDASRR
jgi:hypothetical protein